MSHPVGLYQIASGRKTQLSGVSVTTAEEVLGLHGEPMTGALLMHCQFGCSNVFSAGKRSGM
jgi:hypothetical protein